MSFIGATLLLLLLFFDLLSILFHLLQLFAMLNHRLIGLAVLVEHEIIESFPVNPFRSPFSQNRLHRHFHVVSLLQSEVGVVA